MRLATSRFCQLARQFPAVLILGARQVGKTTLARQPFPDLPYGDLEDPATQALFVEDARFQPDARARPGLMLDEAQRAPLLSSALRGAIDANRQELGRFVILDSAQPSLARQVAESHAGRVGILELAALTARFRFGDRLAARMTAVAGGGTIVARRGTARSAALVAPKRQTRVSVARLEQPDRHWTGRQRSPFQEEPA